MDSFFAISLLDACTGWLGALVLIVVGGVVVAKADKGAGLTLASAGLLKLLLNCCVAAPSAAFRFGFYDIDPTFITMNGVLIQLQRLVIFGLIGFAVMRLTSPPNSQGAAQ